MRRDSRKRRLVYHSAAVLILLLGFALRVHLLDGQSMWSDEGLSLYRARQDTAGVLRNVITVDGIDTRDTNPPLYFLLLHTWQAVAGESVFALRYVGVAAGVAAVALMLPWGRLIAGRRVGLLAGFFLAFSPFHVWETQVLRNYPLLIALNLLSVYALCRFILRPDDPRRRRWLAVWLVASLLGIYTHYFAFFVFAFGVAVLGLWALRQWLAQRKERPAGRRPRAIWALLGLSLLLLLPVAAVALERFAAGQQVDFNWVPPGDVATHAAAAFGVGISRTLTHPWLLWLPAVLLAGLGAAALWRRSRAAALLLLGYLLIPLGLVVALSLFNPLYNGARHLLIGLPPFVLLLAVGVGQWPARSASPLGRSLSLLARGALALAVVAIQASQLRAQFYDPAFARDDVRGAANYLSQVATAGDRIVVHDTLIRFTFDYYYDGAAPVQSIPLYGEQDVAATTSRLLDAGQSAARVWFLTQPFPRNGFPRDALPAQAHDRWTPIGARQFPHLWLPVRVEGYTPDIVQAGLPASATPLTATFRDDLRLDGYELPARVRAGAPWWGQFYLTALAPAEPAYALSLRLEDAAAETWAQLGGPIWPERGPGSWPPGVLIRHDHPFTAPAGLPPGNYGVWLRILDADDQPLPLDGGGAEVYLGELAVDASTDAAQLPDHTAQETRLGPITFLGYRLPEADLRPGHLLTIDVFWQARATPERDYRVNLQMMDTAGNLLAETILPPTRPDYPTTLWQPGDVLGGKLALEIPPMATESATLRLKLIDPEGRPVGHPVTLRESPPIVPWPLETELPPVPQPLSAVFGDGPAVDAPLIALHGFDAPQTAAPGAVVPITLFWQSQVNLDRNLVVLVHLTDEAGNIVAQADGVPVNGMRLTLSWRAGEVLVDEHALQLPAELAPGAYQLWVGFYDPDSGARLAARAGDEVWPDGRLPLTHLTIEGAP